MANPTNPTTLNWVNPTQAKDQSGNTIAYNAAADQAGIEISFDGTPAFVVTDGAVTTQSLVALTPYLALPPGVHTLGLAVATKEGSVSPFAAPVTFSIAVIPLAPTSVVLA